MESHHAAANGIRALSIQSEQGEPNPYTIDSSDGTTLQNAGSRKRQKVTHVTTTPLPVEPQAHNNSQTASAVSFGTHAEPVGGEFDYLLHWQQADDDVVDDDDLIGEDDEGDDGSEEVEEEADGRRQEDIEMLPAAPGRTKLTEAQIVDIINDSIDHHAAAWRPNKDVLKEDEVHYDAEEMWLTAERAGKRHELMKKYEVDVAYYTQRLNKLCDEILRAPGSNVKDVKQQCRHLEVTIDSIELADWLLSIYRLEPTDDDDDNVVNGNTPSSTEVPSALQTLRRKATEVIDLGSPPESSNDDEDGMIVDSSPAPEILTDRRFYTPDSVIGGSIMAESVIPDSATPGSAIGDFVIGDSVFGESAIIDTIEPTTPTTPKHETEGLADSGALTSSSTKKAQPEAPRHAAAAQKPRIRYGDNPQEASMLSSRRWKWEELTSTKDRKRIVTKAIQEMHADDREAMRHRLATVGKADIIREISVCARMLAKGETRMPGVLPRDFPKIVTFARLFLCWWLCDNYFRAEPSKWDLDELQKCLREQSPDPSTFYDYVQNIMNTTFSPEALRHPERPSQAEVIDLISDDEEPASQPHQSRQETQTQRPRPLHPHTPIVLD